MTEITFKNNPIHLEGTEVSKGDVLLILKFWIIV